MKTAFRWYGEGNDSVTLDQIRQIPSCPTIVGVLDSKAAGEVWTPEEIRVYRENIEAHGLRVEVIESVNVHEDIKLGLPTRDEYIANFIKTIENLGKQGVQVVCYNFMPVIDFARTDWAKKMADGSTALYFDQKQLDKMTPSDLVSSTMETAAGFTLPGWEAGRLQKLKDTMKQYEGVTKDDLRRNYQYFLEAVIPTCEEFDVKLAVHPDDPGWEIFGLPRLAHTTEEYQKIMDMVDSPYNGITFCTGSLGSNPDNDIPAMIRHFCKQRRVPFAHVRNVKYLGDKEFIESGHLSSEGSLDMYEIIRAFYESGFDGYIRPDHGRDIWGEKCRPGYGLYDRALGLAYINGLWEAVEKNANRK